MRSFLHKTSAFSQIALSGLLLGPFMRSSVSDERWPVIALALMSLALIFTIERPRTDGVNASWLTSIAFTLVGLGLLLELNKLLLLGGAMFFSAALVSTFPVSRPTAMALAASACLMVPLPAPIETAVAAELARLEASLFVVIGQAIGLPVRLSGAQVFFEQTVVTINQDCSGTLLLIPAVLGAITGSSLVRSNGAALLACMFAAPIALLINLIRIGITLLLIAHGEFASADTWHDGLGFIAVTMSWALPVILFTDIGNIRFSRALAAKVLPATSVLVAMGMAAGFMTSTKPVSGTKAVTLPSYVDGWVAQQITIPQQELKILSANYASRQRFTSTQKEFVVTTIQHTDPDVGREHSSERCFKAMGWQVQTVGGQPFGHSGKLTRLLAKSGGYSQSVLELEFAPPSFSHGFIRIQLVANATTPFDDQIDFLEAFAAHTLGDIS